MSDGGDESDQLAPIIPLFGGSSSRQKPIEEKTPRSETPSSGRADEPAVWRSTWIDGAATEDANPVTALTPRGPSDRHPARGTAARPASRLRALQPHEPQQSGGGSDPDQLREAAEELLVRKLRTRSLSISEARLVLRGYEHNAEKLDAGSIDDVLDDFCRRGYLDDAILAGQLVTSGVERKGQGRIALSRALSQRGIPRDVIDAALGELPDDDAERALEYARTKARGMSRLDGDTALRRLVGQLSRRGYNGSVAMTAAKTALAEASFGRPPTGVRFVDSD